MAHSDVRAWERQDSESDEAHEAFQAYLELGVKRTLVAAGQVLGKSRQLMESWSAKHEWQRRIRAYSRHESRIVTDRLLAETASMRERQAIQGMNLQHRAAARVAKMSDAEIAKMSIREVAQLARLGTDIERRAREISQDELDQQEREDVPSFQVNFLHKVPEKMLSVRLPDGTVGYISEEARAEFEADYPEGVVIA